MPKNTALVFYGDRQCSRVKANNVACTNGAYYEQDGAYLCGVHARKASRKELPKHSAQHKRDAAKAAFAKQMVAIEEQARQNADRGVRGDLTMCKMRMMRAPEHREGYLSVFPNYKDQNRSDGYGCARLSPKSIGPVHHGQPGLPPSRNLENFHQGSKLFLQEADDAGRPTQTYYENRLAFYNDPEPHRHKFIGTDPQNKNIPICFLWRARDGVEHRLSYVESRQFYCHFYERAAAELPELAKLRELLASGHNLQICGYDARDGKVEDLDAEYLDPSAPFGHELVLYSMLTIGDPERYPWRRHKTFEF